jgi:serine/threonine-protein kinase HipA
MASASPTQRNIYAALWHLGKWHAAGVIVFDKQRKLAGFSYFDNYTGPPLDPVNLNYVRAKTKSFAVNVNINQNMLHRVFSDALPGAWGMAVLMAEHPSLKTMNDAERLAWFGSRTVGGIMFRSGLEKAAEVPVKGMDHLEKIRAESVAFHMKKLMKIAGARTKWGLVSHGGARPKVAYEDEEGNHWIAKFNLQLDDYNNAAVENATLRLAHKAGLPVPDTKVIRTPTGEELVLIKRFDRHGEHRSHQISLFSMMDEAKIRSHDQADYMDFFKVIDLASADPVADKKIMFAQMMFNIGVNNTDDHAKNFSMILKDEGYRLSPCYDITPNTRDYPHTTSIFGNPRANMDPILLMGIEDKVGIPRWEAKQIFDRINVAVSHWKEAFVAAGVPMEDIKKLSEQMNTSRKMNDLTFKKENLPGHFSNNML